MFVDGKKQKMSFVMLLTDSKDDPVHRKNFFDFLNT
jgi:hypothetical protein